MVTAAKASEGVTTCDLHTELIDLAHFTSSAPSDVGDAPPQSREDDSLSESALPDPTTPTPISRNVIVTQNRVFLTLLPHLIVHLAPHPTPVARFASLEC